MNIYFDKYAAAFGKWLSPGCYLIATIANDSRVYPVYVKGSNHL